MQLPLVERENGERGSLYSGTWQISGSYGSVCLAGKSLFLPNFYPSVVQLVLSIPHSNVGSLSCLKAIVEAHKAGRKEEAYLSFVNGRKERRKVRLRPISRNSTFMFLACQCAQVECFAGEENYRRAPAISPSAKMQGGWKPVSSNLDADTPTSLQKEYLRCEHCMRKPNDARLQMHSG